MKKINLYNDVFLSQMRIKADESADEVVHQIYATNNKDVLNLVFSEIKVNNKPIPKDLPDFVINYFNTTSKLPAWADDKKMAEGAQFFSKYSSQILLLLGFYSLPYCYAAANGAQVLQITKRITDDPGKRFLETSEFVMDVMAPNAFEGRGKGIRSAQKVRLIHALVRQYASKDKRWDAAWGLPVNQEDMAGTNLSFSLIVIRGLRKMGIDVPPSEAAAYMHLWNVVGYILGVDERLLPDTSKEAFVLDKLISQRQFKSSTAGKELTLSLLNFIKSTSPPGLPGDFVSAYMRYFLGDEIGDLLEIPQSSINNTIFSSIQGVNKISTIFGFNKSDYFQTRHMINMQKRMEE